MACASCEEACPSRLPVLNGMSVGPSAHCPPQCNHNVTTTMRGGGDHPMACERCGQGEDVACIVRAKRGGRLHVRARPCAYASRGSHVHAPRGSHLPPTCREMASGHSGVCSRGAGSYGPATGRGGRRCGLRVALAHSSPCLSECTANAPTAQGVGRKAHPGWRYRARTAPEPSGGRGCRRPSW